MTSRELMDGLCGTLLADERILSAAERDLLTSLLQRTRARGSGCNDAVEDAITRSVGEVIAQRALGVLGESITAQLLKHQLSGSAHLPTDNVAIHAGTPPITPPSPTTPRTPGGNPPSIIRVGTPPTTPPPPPTTPRTPGGNPPSIIRVGTPPIPAPATPRTPGGNPPSNIRIATSVPVTDGVRLSARWKAGESALLEAPESQYLVFDEFLTPAELNGLMQYTLENESQFELSEVLTPGVTGSAIDYEQRRSRVLMDLGGNEKAITDRLLACLPRFLEKWGRDAFPVSRIESQITASNDGDYFRAHTDDGVPEVSSREVTFVYFFHREPKQFSGGELRIYDATAEGNGDRASSSYRAIVPQQNQLVLFASGLSHEITPVNCPSGKFEDSRFTVNGWLHR